jgi:hypothetical protein
MSEGNFEINEAVPDIINHDEIQINISESLDSAIGYLCSFVDEPKRFRARLAIKMETGEILPEDIIEAEIKAKHIDTNKRPYLEFLKDHVLSCSEKRLKYSKMLEDRAKLEASHDRQLSRNARKGHLREL